MIPKLRAAAGTQRCRELVPEVPPIPYLYKATMGSAKYHLLLSKGASNQKNIANTDLQIPTSLQVWRHSWAIPKFFHLVCDPSKLQRRKVLKLDSDPDSRLHISHHLFHSFRHVQEKTSWRGWTDVPILSTSLFCNP